FADPQLLRTDDLATGPVFVSPVATTSASVGVGALTIADADGIVRIFDLRGEELARIDSGSGAIARVWMTTAATRLVISRDHGTVEIWDGSHRLLGPIAPWGRMVEYLDEARLLEVTRVDGSVQIWGPRGLEARLPDLGDVIARPGPDARDIMIA